MDPIDILRNEHGLIRQFLDNLTLATGQLEEGKRPPRTFFDKAVEFANGFADDLHHFKEEHVLFVRLAQKKRGEVDAQLDALRQQHERGRGFVNGMKHALDGFADGDSTWTADLLENAAAYCALLRHHIYIEDHQFFPMARKELDATDLELVQQEFDRQRAKRPADEFERFHKILVDMGSDLAHTA